MLSLAVIILNILETFYKPFRIADLHTFCVGYIKISLLSNRSCITLWSNSLPVISTRKFPIKFSTHNLFGLWSDSFTIAAKGLRTVLPFSSFKDLAHAYLVKTSMTYNKYLIFLFLGYNNPISSKSTDQILPLSLAESFLFWIF